MSTTEHGRDSRSALTHPGDRLLAHSLQSDSDLDCLCTATDCGCLTAGVNPNTVELAHVYLDAILDCREAVGGTVAACVGEEGKVIVVGVSNLYLDISAFGSFANATA